MRSSRASSLAELGPPRSSRASADVSGHVSSPSGGSWRMLRTSRPTLTRSAAAIASTSEAIS